MIRLPLTILAVMAGGRAVASETPAWADHVSTDTRTIQPGSLFVAIIGERHDAHNFTADAVAKGASIVLVSREDAIPPNTAGIVVEDTVIALQKLAAAYRLMRPDFLAIGITGSNGKTSTKDFTTAVFSHRHHVNATKGNLNNHIGLPLTVLQTNPDHTVGVWEMGMNHFGEIAPLAAIAKPQIAIITNIGTAHIEFLGSREGIALEKGALVEALDEKGTAILNHDDDFTPSLAARCRGRVITAGLTGGDVTAQNINGSSFLLVHGADSHPVTLPVPGRHMINNALLAAAAGLVSGMKLADIATALSQARLHGGRLERRSVAGLSILDDSYNANPDSMKAALTTLAQEPCAGRRIAVFGHMGELGEHALSGHTEVGIAAHAARIHFLITVGGEQAQWINQAYGQAQTSRHFATHAEAGDFLKSWAQPNDLILIKGSRSAKMENVIAHLQTQTPPTS